MKKFLQALLVILFFNLSLFFFVSPSSSDEIDDLAKQISDLTQKFNQSKAATAPLESQLKDMKNQIDSIKNRVRNIEFTVIQKKQTIDDGYKKLAKQEKILYKTVRDYYIKNYYNSPLITFISAGSASQLTQELAYQKATTDQDRSIITNIALTIQDLEIKKKNLEEEEKRLTTIKTDLDEQSAKLDKVITGAKEYQAKLSTQIAELSAKQREILAQKLISLGLPTSAYTTLGGCSNDLTNGKDPGFSPRFGFFTYGVPHRVGMSQYGAKGRADAGQNSDTILHAYFNFDGFQNFDVNKNIKVNDSNGFNSGNIIWSGRLDDYVKRIYEVPDSWPMESLKAQAIAARSYVLATTNNGDMSICANQNCQVFKTDPKGGNWENAVNQTAGQVIVQGGSPIQAWFSSTAGGYEFNSGDVWGGGSKPWTKNMLDANGSVGSFSDLQSKAYDKDSPWFYCDWGSRSQYSGTAWLKPEEAADIVNVISLLQNDSSLKEHLYQTDKSNPAGTDNWDESRVKQELKNRNGSVFNSISDISVSADFTSGRTTSVTVNGDAGSKSFPGDLFKTYFNLRAPSNINIVGPLYNIEKK